MFLRQTVLVQQLAVRVRFFQRIQVSALDVLDQRHFQARLRRGLFDHRRYGRHACHLDRPPTSFAGNQLKRAIWLLADQHRLQDAVLSDGIRQLLQLLLVKVGPRLPRIGSNVADRYLAQADGGARDQRTQPAPQPALVRFTHLSSPSLGPLRWKNHRSSPRPISSCARSA